MKLSPIITFLVGLVAHAWVVLLLTAIVLGNLYALLHAWRSDRIGWFLVILLTGGGVATAGVPRGSPRRAVAATTLRLERALSLSLTGRPPARFA
jgi:hypothetical protein